MVTLICGKARCTVSEQKAQSLLYIQKQMRLNGWKLPKNSPYEFIDNALIKRPDKEDCKGESERQGDSTGDKASTKA
jgi:hypothetical protein